MKFTQGDVYWYTIPSKNNTKSIPHPYVIIQETVMNQSKIDSIVICGITSNMKKASWPGNIILNLNEANLTKQSIIDVSQILTVKKVELGEYIGKLSSDRIIQIFSGMKLIHSFQEHRKEP